MILNTPLIVGLTAFIFGYVNPIDRYYAGFGGQGDWKIASTCAFGALVGELIAKILSPYTNKAQMLSFDWKPMLKAMLFAGGSAFLTATFMPNQSLFLYALAGGVGGYIGAGGLHTNSE